MVTARQESVYLILREDTTSFQSSSKAEYAVFHWGGTLHLSYTYKKIQTSNPEDKSVTIKILFDE